MGFAENAIGFYMDLDSSNLEKGLASASTKYDKFVKQLTVANARAVKTVSSGIDQMAEMIQSLGKSPQAAVKGYAEVQKQLSKAASKPIIQKVEFKFVGGQDAAKAIAGALGNLLKSAKLDLKPGKGDWLEKAFGKMPKFAGGGLVTKAMKLFGLKGADTVLARLQPGELVLPPELVKSITKGSQAAAFLNVPGHAIPQDARDLRSAVGEINKMSRGLDPKLFAGQLDTLRLIEQTLVKGFDGLRLNLEVLNKGAGQAPPQRPGGTPLSQQQHLPAATAATAQHAAAQQGPPATAHGAVAAPSWFGGLLHTFGAGAAKARGAFSGDNLRAVRDAVAGPLKSVAASVAATAHSVASQAHATAARFTGPAAPTAAPAATTPAAAAPRIRPATPLPAPPAAPLPPAGPMLGNAGAIMTLNVRGNPLTSLLRNIDVLRKELRDLKAAEEAGLGPQVQGRYAKAMRVLTVQMKELDYQTKTYGYDTLKGLLPEINDAKDKFKDLTRAAKDAGGPWEQFFTKILGPARFLAVNKAIGEVGEGVAHLFASTSGVFDHGNQKLGDFVDNFNEVNKVMGLTRDQLHQLKGEVLDDAKAFGGSFDPTEISAAFAALRRANFSTDVKQLRDMTGALAAMGKAADTDVGTVANFLSMLSFNTKLTNDNMKDLLANSVVFSQKSGASAEQTMQAVQQAAQEMTGVIRDLNADQQKQLLTGLTKFTSAVEGTAGDVGKTLTHIISQAAAGNLDAMHQLQQLGATVTDPRNLQEMLMTGRGMDEFVKRIGKTINGIPKERLADVAAQFGLTAEQLSQISTKGDAAVSMLHMLDKSSVAAGTGMAVLKDIQDRNITTFQKFLNTVSNTIGSLHAFGVQGVDVIDFLKEFGVQNLHATVYLLRLVPGVGKLGKGIRSLAGWGVDAVRGLLGFGKAAATVATTAEAAATATTVMAGAEGAATTASGGLGASIAALGEGIGMFIAAIGTGAGTAISGTLAGLATGIEVLGAAAANPIGLAGIGAFAAVVLTTAAAFRIATPTVEAIGKVANHYLDTVSHLFSTFMEADASKMLAVGPALAGIGVGFAAFGAGMFTGSVALGLAAVPMAAFAATLKLFGTGGLAGAAGSLAGTVNALAAAFVVNTDQLDRAVHGVQSSAKFLAALALLYGTVTAAGIVSGGGVLGGIASLWTRIWLGDPMQNLITHATDVVNAVNALSDTMQGIDATKLPEASKKLAAVAQFTSDYAKLNASVKAITPTGGLVGWVVDLFTGSDAEGFQALREKQSHIADAINSLSSVVARWPVGDDLPKAAKKLGVVAEFMSGYAKIIEGMKAAGTLRFWSDGGVETSKAQGLWGKLALIFGGDDIKKLTDAAPKVRGALVQIVGMFSHPLIANESLIPVAVAGLKNSADIMSGTVPLFEAASKASAAADPLKPGVFESLFGTQGQISKLAGVATDLSTNLANSIIPAFAGIDVGIKAGAWTLKGIDDDNAIALAMIGGLTDQLTALGKLADVWDKVKGGIATVPAAAQQIQAAMAAVIATSAAQKVAQVPTTAPAVSAATLPQTMSVTVKGRVESEDATTHALLEKLADLIAKMTPGAAQPTVGTPVTRGPGRAAQDLADGRVS